MKVHCLEFTARAEQGPPVRLELVGQNLYISKEPHLVNGNLKRAYDEAETRDKPAILMAEPTEEDWAAFYSGLKGIHIGKWKSEYKPNGQAAEGPDWKFNVRMGDIQMASAGVLACPGAEVGVSQPYRKLLHLLDELSNDGLSRLLDSDL